MIHALCLVALLASEPRTLASHLAEVTKKTGVLAVCVTLLSKENVSAPPIDQIDAGNVEKHLLALCPKLPNPGRLVRLYLPKGPNWTAEEVLAYARAEAILYRKSVGEIRDDTIEVLGKTVPRSEADAMIKALDLRPIYVVLPKEVNFGGRWQTTYGEMILEQKNGKITGTYSTNGGTIGGTVKGNEWRMIWFEQNGTSGSGNFIMSDDGMSFSGPWYNRDSNAQAGVWTGKRQL